MGVYAEIGLFNIHTVPSKYGTVYSKSLDHSKDVQVITRLT